jgi:hypothetical protein
VLSKTLPDAARFYLIGPIEITVKSLALDYHGTYFSLLGEIIWTTLSQIFFVWVERLSSDDCIVC